MIDIFRPIADAWVRRYARSSPEANRAVEGLLPATVVTGASQGLGLALARRFAAGGSAVVLVARRRELLEVAANAITAEFNVKAVALDLDISAADTTARIEEGLASHGVFADCLVNNAGVGLSGSFQNSDMDAVERVLSVNVAALTRLMRHFLQPMLERGRGGILNVGSVGGYTPGPNQAAYYASKAFVISLTEAVAFETRGRGVRVCVVAPGPIDTRFHRTMGADRSVYRFVFPSASPEQVANAAYRGFVLGRHVVVPGLLPTVSMLAARVLPHPILLPIVAGLLNPVQNTSLDPRQD